MTEGEPVFVVSGVMCSVIARLFTELRVVRSAHCKTIRGPYFDETLFTENG